MGGPRRKHSCLERPITGSLAKWAGRLKPWFPTPSPQASFLGRGLGSKGSLSRVSGEERPHAGLDFGCCEEEGYTGH